MLIIPSILIGSLLRMLSNLISVMVRAHTTCAHFPSVVGFRAPPRMQHKQHSCWNMDMEHWYNLSIEWELDIYKAGFIARIIFSLGHKIVSSFRLVVTVNQLLQATRRLVYNKSWLRFNWGSNLLLLAAGGHIWCISTGVCCEEYLAHHNSLQSECWLWVTLNGCNTKYIIPDKMFKIITSRY